MKLYILKLIWSLVSTVQAFKRCERIQILMTFENKDKCSGIIGEKG
jgi:hypothetical protein